jgi:hypothetical protein
VFGWFPVGNLGPSGGSGRDGSWFAVIVASALSRGDHCWRLGEFDEVVGEHAMAAPDACAVVTADPGARQCPVPFEMRDPSF